MEVYNERIDKILAASGLLSRSEARKAVKCGRVTVDGKTVTDFDAKVSNRNILALDGKIIEYSKFVYVLLNKPQGYVCSTDERDGTPVMEIFGDIFGSHDVAPVGRLDKNTTGALLLTDNGVLGHMLLSPSKHVEKVYYCETLKEIRQECIDLFASGVDIGDDTLTKAAKLEIISSNSALLTITEGKFHQVKRMFEAVENKVTRLHRVSFASLTTDIESDAGKWRYLEPSEVEHLFEIIGKKAQ